MRKYHLRILSLFAACAEGENRYIESMCQTMFSIDEILDVLCDTQIDHLSKTAYLKYGTAL
jgi:inositol 1,4,5-triphosphate receptor type 1